MQYHRWFWGTQKTPLKSLCMFLSDGIISISTVREGTDGMITDFHAFTVPGGDGGCMTFDDTRLQLRLAADAGIERLVAVSDFDSRIQAFPDFRRQISAGRDFILGRDFKYAPQILLVGTVVTVTQDLDKIDDLEDLCIIGTNVIMLAIPEGILSDKLVQAAVRIRDNRNLTPVIIRAERHSAAERFLSNEISCAFSASAFTSLFGKKKLLKQAALGNVSAIGSDMRGLRYDYIEFKNAIAALGVDYEKICERTDRLLAGK